MFYHIYGGLRVVFYMYLRIPHNLVIVAELHSVHEMRTSDRIMLAIGGVSHEMRT